MIVVDTNVIAYLLLDVPLTELAQKLWEREPEWAAPILWRSELASVLNKYRTMGQLELGNAIRLFSIAEEIFEDREFSPSVDRVLELAAVSGCSTYDCEYLAIAEGMEAPLVTNDKELLESFPEQAMPLKVAASEL